MGYLRKMQILYTAKVKKMAQVWGKMGHQYSLGHKLGDIFNDLAIF